MQNKILIVVFFFNIICLFSCQQTDIVVARVDHSVISHWPRSGDIIKYSLKFEKNGKQDSTMLIGNKIYVTGTNTRFYLEPGDSVVVKLGRFYHGFYNMNKFIKIHSLTTRFTETVPIISELPISTQGVYSQYDVDKPALFPKAKDNEENTILIKDFFRNQLEERHIYTYEPISFHLKVDTFGKASFYKIFNNDPEILNVMYEIIEEFPLFTPAELNGKKVDAGVTYYIK